MSRTALFRSVARALSKALNLETAAGDLAITRRDGLKLAAVSSLTAYLNACQSPELSSPAQPSGSTAGPHRKVVIVGGGAAGLSAAYYLKKAGIKSHIYEANNRLGGRIFTEYDFNEEGMFCEKGGELIDTGHKEIQSLMNEFGLELEQLPDPSRVAEVHFFDKAWQSEEDLIEGFRPLAKKIAADAKGFMVNGEFTMPSYKEPLSDAIKLLDHMTLDAYLNSDHESPPWVHNLIRVAYVGEYGLDADEQSAINLVSFIGTELSKGFKLFGESDEQFRIRGGSSLLIKSLEKNLRGHYTTNLFLTSIARGLDGHFQLLFQKMGADGKFDPSAQATEVRANTCILTLPFTVLRAVKGIDKIGLSARKLQAIRELGYGTNTKLMLGFSSRFWRETDKSFPPSDGSLLTDLKFQGGWDSSRQQKGNSGIFTNFLGGTIGKTFTNAMANKSLADLNTVYPGIKDLVAKKRVLQVWAAVPTAMGSYICQKPGQYTTIGGCFGEAECGGQLLFAGEHTSEVSAGFMNGAVESGLRVAASVINNLAPIKAKGP